MIGVVADDITGAAELGAIGLRHGLSAEVLLHGAPVPTAPLVCVDTDSRSCAPTEAGQRAASAARALVSAGASWIYKKVDSVLRGRVVAELTALMTELQLPRTLLVPANPSLGRVIRDGQYVVKGKPIHETEFRHDPEYPRRSANVLDLLGTANESFVHVCRPVDPLPPSGILIGDVTSSDELKRWTQQLDDSTLAAGGAEFFGAVLEGRGFPARPSIAPFALPPSANGELFVCGSTSEACGAFVVKARHDGVRVFGLPPELFPSLESSVRSPESQTPNSGLETPDSGLWIDRLADEISATFQTRRRVILTTGLPLIQKPEIARALAGCLAKGAAAVLARAAGVRLFVEGGATAVELVRRIGWPRLTVMGELSPGVVSLRSSKQPENILTLKPGSYVWPAALLGGAIEDHPR